MKSNYPRLYDPREITLAERREVADINLHENEQDRLAMQRDEKLDWGKKVEEVLRAAAEERCRCKLCQGVSPYALSRV